MKISTLLYNIVFLFFYSIHLNGQIITTIAGDGTGGHSGYGGAATLASIYDPHGGVFDRYGNLYIVQSQEHIISKTDSNGIITVFAGTPLSNGFSGDLGYATAAKLNYPNAIAIDTVGNIYITDAGNYRVRKVDTNSIITTFAGNGISGFAGDGGQATSAKIGNGIWGICIDNNGNVYISDGYNYRIRKIDVSGIISTILGNGIMGFSGEGGHADSAECSLIMGMCIDEYNNLYFADASNNNRVRKIDTFGIVTTLAGNGVNTYNGDDMPATNAQLGPLDIRVYRDKIYVADITNDRIREIESGYIHTLCGTGTSGYNGDYIIDSNAEINTPGGLAIDMCGNLSFGDLDNARFRKITFDSICTTHSLSLPNETGEISIKLYPNPAYDVIHLHGLSGNTTYTITDMPGKTLLTGTVDGVNNSIKVNALPQGVYILQITNAQDNMVFRVVKE